MKKKLKDSPEILTVKQLAKYLQMDEHTVYRLAKNGKNFWYENWSEVEI